MQADRRSLLDMWKWCVVRDCPVVLIALDDIDSKVDKAETVLKELFDLHAWQVSNGQVAVTAVTTSPASWVEVRDITYAIKMLSFLNDERTKNYWEVLFSKICTTFKNREVTPHIHLITNSQSSTVPFDKLQSFEGKLIFHVHQLGSQSFTLPKDLPEPIQLRHTLYDTDA